MLSPSARDLSAPTRACPPAKKLIGSASWSGHPRLHADGRCPLHRRIISRYNLYWWRQVPDEDLADAGGGASMSETVGNNAWAELIHHTHDGILELRWLPVKMTDSGFKATLAL